jgi:hypothetical protein
MEANHDFAVGSSKGQEALRVRYFDQIDVLGFCEMSQPSSQLQALDKIAHKPRTPVLQRYDSDTLVAVFAGLSEADHCHPVASALQSSSQYLNDGANPGVSPHRGILVTQENDVHRVLLAGPRRPFGIAKEIPGRPAKKR